MNASASGGDTTVITSTDLYFSIGYTKHQKKEGKTHFCVDYHTLNNEIKGWLLTGTGSKTLDHWIDRMVTEK